MIKLIPKIFPRNETEHDAKIERALIRHEAKIGGQLFGPVPKGHRRDFFCLDEHTWIWHEQWVDKKGTQHTITTRYEIHSNGILKLQNGHYNRLTPNEARNLYHAIGMYGQKVQAEYQRMLQPA